MFSDYVKMLKDLNMFLQDFTIIIEENGRENFNIKVSNFDESPWLPQIKIQQVYIHEENRFEPKFEIEIPNVILENENDLAYFNECLHNCAQALYILKSMWKSKDHFVKNGEIHFVNCLNSQNELNEF